MKLDKRKLVKQTTSLVVGFGTAKIVNDTIRNNVDLDNPVKNITVGVAAFAIGGMVADAATTYTDRMIDELADAINEFRQPNSTN